MKSTIEASKTQDVAEWRLTWAVRTALVLATAVMGFIDYWEYSKTQHRDPDAWMSLVFGQGTAPSQYRIGVIRLGYFLTQHLHLAFRHVFAMIDMASGLAAVWILFSLLQGSSTYRVAGRTYRVGASLTYTALVQFYFSWVVGYQRPETLPTLLLVTLTFLCLSRRIAGSVLLTGFVVILLALIQGVVRADVAFALHSGVLLFCLLPSARNLRLGRTPQMITSLLGMMVAGAMQYYLMHVAYPQANYGDTPVIQFWMNFRELTRLVAFVLFIGPFAATLFCAVKAPKNIEIPSRALMVGAVVYACLWLIVGKIDEVRIFLPFACVLAPATALLAAGWLIPQGDEAV